MAINLAEAFSKKVAEAFKQDSLTDSATGHDYSFSGTRTVRVWSVDTVPLVDYQRTGSNRYGTPVELGDTVQEMTMRDEKSWTFTIDKGNQSDQYNIKGATRAAKRQIEQQVIPYVDKYRFREWCTNAGIIEGLSAAPTKGDIVDAIFDAGAAMSDRLVPWSNRTLYIPNEYFKLLALSDQFISIEALGKKSVSKGEVGEIDNMVVKRVPASYLPAGVYFLVKYKGSTVDPVKLNDMKIHQDPPGIGGNLLEGRIYHDSFVLGTKANGLYVAGASGSVTAAPTIKDTTGTVTITKKGTCKYTVDGTDPRYSATAQVYDRLLIFKTDSAYSCSYSTLTLGDGSVSAAFYTSSLNRSIGNAAPGQAKLVDNNARTVYGRSVYEWSLAANSVRDERNAKRVSDKVAATLGAFDLTQAICFDDEWNQEYYIFYGGQAIVNNYQNNSWYFYDNLPVNAVVAVEGTLYFGTLDGRIMEFSREYRNDNLEDINAYWESGSMDFDLDWRRKYSSTVWTAMKPESQAIVTLTAESNVKSEYPDKIVSAGLATFLNMSFEHWSFGTNRKPQLIRSKLKVKKVTYYKLIIRSKSASATATVLSVDLQVRYTGNVK